MTRSKILYGVCGIGNGHTFRQLPIIKHYAETSDIVIFAYGESLNYLSNRFKDTPSITIEPVAIPFYVGNKDGLDFDATAKHPANQNKDFSGINARAMAKAEDRIGKPNVVISDYEGICAQYAYAYNAPLVTIDQQSKYLCGQFPQPLNGQYYQDEVARLRMFFPKAEARIACSFFDVEKNPAPHEHVDMHAPILSDWITQLDRSPDLTGKTMLVYLSSQKPFGQNMADVADILQDHPEHSFHIFGKDICAEKDMCDLPNVTPYNTGDARFRDLLKTCNGLVTTAGHSLLSEAMYLGVPTYAIPLPLYEQQMNAHVIGTNGFGVSHEALETAILGEFIRNIPDHSYRIENDSTVLLRSQGKQPIIDKLDQFM